MIRILSELGLELPSIIAGILGGVISLTYEKEKTSPAKAGFLILTGACTAGYLTPMVAEYGNIGDNLQAGLSFVIGLSSMHIIKSLPLLVDKITKRITDGKG